MHHVQDGAEECACPVVVPKGSEKVVKRQWKVERQGPCKAVVLEGRPEVDEASNREQQGGEVGEGVCQ